MNHLYHIKHAPRLFSTAVIAAFVRSQPRLRSMTILPVAAAPPPAAAWANEFLVKARREIARRE
jgi:hypothetical protein